MCSIGSGTDNKTPIDFLEINPGTGLRLLRPTRMIDKPVKQGFICTSMLVRYRWSTTNA